MVISFLNESTENPLITVCIHMVFNKNRHAPIILQAWSTC